MLTLAHYTAIQEMFESGDGFAFARFNDGEMRGIKSIGDTAYPITNPIQIFAYHGHLLSLKAR